VEVKKRVCREGKKNKNISGGRKWKAEVEGGSGRRKRIWDKGVSAGRKERGKVQRGGKCREGESAERGKCKERKERG
jgi:hypothetical protein